MATSGLNDRQSAFVSRYLLNGKPVPGSTGKAPDGLKAAISEQKKALARLVANVKSLIKDKPASAPQLMGLVGAAKAAIDAADVDESHRQIDLLQDYVDIWMARQPEMTVEEMVSPDLLSRQVEVNAASGKESASAYADAMQALPRLRPALRRSAEAFEAQFARIREETADAVRRLLSGEVPPDEHALLVSHVEQKRSELQTLIEGMQATVKKELAQ